MGIHIIQHEYVHQRICLFYGGIPGPTTINSALSFESPCYINNPDRNYWLAQSINEIVGYSLESVITILVFIFVVLYYRRK